MLLRDSMTSKSFDEVAHSIAEAHYTLYLSRRASYFESFTITKRSANLSSQIIQPTFSQVDDPNGYNESRGPYATFLVDLFVEYYNSRKDIIKLSLENIKPHSIMSLDHTYNNAGRTKGTDGQSIIENSLLFAMNGTGQIVKYRRCSQENHTDIKALLTEIRDQCDRLKHPHPRTWYVDNAGNQS
jgi:hypothetical protein